MECEFCKNTFKTKATLRSHQNTTKYCIKLQNRKEYIKTYTCASCKRSFTRIESFKRHEKTCKIIEIARQKEEIASQKEEIAIQKEEIASQKENTSEEVSIPEEMEVDSHNDEDNEEDLQRKEQFNTQEMYIQRVKEMYPHYEEIWKYIQKWLIVDALETARERHNVPDDIRMCSHDKTMLKIYRSSLLIISDECALGRIVNTSLYEENKRLREEIEEQKKLINS